MSLSYQYFTEYLYEITFNNIPSIFGFYIYDSQYRAEVKEVF
jgi:hypothetical protein